jgi:hypothetical protein
LKGECGKNCKLRIGGERKEKSCGGRGILFQFFEELVDALGVFLGVVEGEMELGDAAELEAFENFVTDKIAGVFEGFDSAFLFGFSAANADQDAGVAHVLGDKDLIDDHGHFEAGILEFSSQHGVDFVGDFFADAFVTMVDGGHGRCVDCKMLLYSIAAGSTSVAGEPIQNYKSIKV